MGNKKAYFVFVIIGLCVLIGYLSERSIMPKLRHHLEVRWHNQFDEGDDIGERRTERIIRWVDPRMYALIHADSVVVEIMRGARNYKSSISRAIDGINDSDYSDLPASDQEIVIEKKAVLNAMAGNITVASGQARNYCQRLWPEKKTLASCLNFHIEFISYALDRYGSVALYAHVKLNEALGVTGEPVLKYYEALALMAFDIDKARRLRNELISDHEFSQKMRERYCDTAQYYSATHDDMTLCASTKSIPGVYSKHAK